MNLKPVTEPMHTGAWAGEESARRAHWRALQACLRACTSLGLGLGLGCAFPSRQFLAERLRCSLLWLGGCDSVPAWVRSASRLLQRLHGTAGVACMPWAESCASLATMHSPCAMLARSDMKVRTTKPQIRASPWLSSSGHAPQPCTLQPFCAFA